ncbi:unnamed protein product [Parnassius mnemosyne]|uniref:Uncharacterized protein n=1 Tax=Parnassius mnemosyne TaxID=213953 RepID=A0AAV1LQR6_9NEOP
MAENSENTTGIKRKQPKMKKETVIKLKKAQGKEHINHRNNLIKKRVVGPDCRCKVLKCYTKISSQDRENIILHFNKLGNKNDQDAYLMSLISSSYPKRHTTEAPQKYRMASYSFKIRVGVNEIPVCLTAFCNIHGVTKGRVRRLQHLISINILTPKDMRGSHKSNRYKKTPEEVLNLVRNHIESFKTMQSHYSLRQDPNCRYLPENLTVLKMFNMFLNSYQIRVTYMVYWLVFKN